MNNASGSSSKPKWYEGMFREANSIAEELGLDDHGTQKLRDFVFETAKEQYKRGNRSGIAWAFSQAEKRAQATA